MTNYLKNVNYLAFFIILIGVFLLPFNSTETLLFLGEYSRDICIVFFILALLIGQFGSTITIPHNSIQFCILFCVLGWFLLTGIFNYADMQHYYFKKTNGTTRYIRQVISLLISSVVILLCFYNVLKKIPLQLVLYKVRKYMLFSFILVIAYGSIEYLILSFKINQLRDILFLFDYLPFTEVRLDKWTKRISSLTYETPALATYLVSIAGWMFSYIVTNKGSKRFIPGFFVILFAFLSGSRAGFFIILVQSIVFGLYLMKDRKFKSIFVKIFLMVFVIGSLAFVIKGKAIYNYVTDEISSFKTTDETHALSNKSRFGIQLALIEVFLENPIIGTGYGLQAYEARSKYPDWAVKGNWEFRVKYLNENHPNFPPGYNVYLRILAETGIIGFLLFLLLITSILFWCYNNAFLKGAEKSILPMIICVSMIGLLLNWLKMDTLRIYGFWLCLSIIFIIEENKRKVAYE